VRYPSSWKTEDGSREGVWYRHFQGPPGAAADAAVTVTLLAGPTAGTLDQYAQSYLAGATSVSVEEAPLQGAGGKRWRYASADGSRRFGLLLVQDGGYVWGLHAQGAPAGFEGQRPVVEAMEKSLTFERPRDYTEHRQERQGVAIRVPASWTIGQNFSTGATYLLQFLSPPLAVDKRQTLHASLTLNVEPAPAAGLDAYYASVRQRLGDAYKVLTEVSWRGGRVVMMRVETPLAVSRTKRYYWTAGQRGYSLTCEAREDVFLRVTRWCDVIASTLEIEGRPLPPEAPPVPAASPTTAPALIAR
jgi:hypothetical protein